MTIRRESAQLAQCAVARTRIALASPKPPADKRNSRSTQPVSAVRGDARPRLRQGGWVVAGQRSPCLSWACSPRRRSGLVAPMDLLFCQVLDLVIVGATRWAWCRRSHTLKSRGGGGILVIRCQGPDCQDVCISFCEKKRTHALGPWHSHLPDRVREIF